MPLHNILYESRLCECLYMCTALHRNTSGDQQRDAPMQSVGTPIAWPRHDGMVKTSGHYRYNPYKVCGIYTQELKN